MYLLQLQIYNQIKIKFNLLESFCAYKKLLSRAIL